MLYFGLLESGVKTGVLSGPLADLCSTVLTLTKFLICSLLIL